MNLNCRNDKVAEPVVTYDRQAMCADWILTRERNQTHLV